MFIPGETITHKFNMPFANTDIGRIYVSYKQENRIILTKPVYPGEVQRNPSGVGCYFTVTLSQEESLLFKNDMNYKIQLNVVFVSGARCSSVELDGTNGIQHIRKVVSANG